MMRRKVFCLALCLGLLLAALSVAFGEADASPQTRRLRLGSSMYTMEVDASYIYGEVTGEDAAGGQVAYLYSDRLAVDFDVYQRGSDGESLAEYVAREADARGGADEVVADGDINGIPAGWYRAVETWNGVDYQTVTYVLDDGEDFVEIVFWLDGEDAVTAVQGMIGTLAREDLVPVRLGSSRYWIFCSASFREGGMTSEDVADDQVAYWVSEETRLDFDVYQFGKEGLPEHLADYVVLEASEYDGVSEIVPEAEVNGIPVGWYRTREAYEGVEYDTLTCVLDAGGDYVEIVFWLDGLTAGAEADAILQSLWMEEPDPTEEEEGFFGEAEVSEGEEAGGSTGGTGDDVIEGEPVEAEEIVEAETAPAEEGYFGEAEAAEGTETEEVVEAETASTEVIVDAMVEAMEEPVAEIPEAGEDVLEAGAAAEDAEAQAMEYAAEADATEAALEAEAEAARAEEMEKAGIDGEATKVLRLGTSPFTLVVPAGFIEGEVTPEDIEDDQVAYYYSYETLLDFDVYQFSKDGYPDDLAVYAAEEAAGYNDVSELVADGEINGIPAAWYRTVEAYQDAEFNTLTYILDGGDEYAEVVFWLDGENADAEAEAIIRTLSRDDSAGEAPSDDGPDAYGAPQEAPADDGPDAVGEEAVEAAE